ncbi:MAG: DUF4397 domain-containing protein [Acidobacteriia bacterium]|nr:DUF4397 domain-containing protein [Terriglobia bacterium]
MGRILRLTSWCAGILCFGTVLLLAGCGGGGGSTRYRFMNAVPDESSLEVLVDSNSVSSNLAYGTSTGYQSVQSGSHQVAIEPAGSSTALLQQSITFASGSDTTIISYNFSQSAANMVLADNNSAPASGDFKLRVVNVSPNLGPADVYVVTPGTDLNTVSPTLSNLAFGSAASYQSLTAGSYEVVLTSVGQKQKAIDTGSLTLSSGQVRTLVGMNSQAGGFSYTMLQDVN